MDRASGVLGRLGLPGALERSAVPQQSGSVHHQGRLHEGLRQALRQGRRARELQQENEDTDGNGSSQHSRFWGSTGTGLGGTTGNIWRISAARHDLWLEASTGRSAPQRGATSRFKWRTRGRSAGGSRSIWRALLTALQPVHDRQDHEFRAGPLIRPWATIRVTACCSRLKQLVPERRCAGGIDGPNKRSWIRISNNFAPGSVSPGMHGNGKSAVRVVSDTSSCASGSHRPQHRDQSTVCDDRERQRKLDTTVSPCAGCFGSGLGALRPAAKSTCGRRTTGSGI